MSYLSAVVTAKPVIANIVLYLLLENYVLSSYVCLQKEHVQAALIHSNMDLTLALGLY